MFLIVKGTRDGDSPLKISDDADFFVEVNSDSMSLNIKIRYIFGEKLTLKEITYRFNSKNECLFALKDLSTQTLEYSKKELQKRSI